MSNTAPVNPRALNTNQNSTPESFTKLTNEASDAQIKKYRAYAARFSKPQVQTNPNSYVSETIFSGYDKQTIQVVTNEGVLNLSFDATTLFQKYAASEHKPNTQGVVSPTPYSSAQDFFKNVVFGSVLHVFFSKPELKAIQVNYIESIQPVL
jgi:hypothetical protein